jgi:hypothetical protein
MKEQRRKTLCRGYPHTLSKKMYVSHRFERAGAAYCPCDRRFILLNSYLYRSHVRLNRSASPHRPSPPPQPGIIRSGILGIGASSGAAEDEWFSLDDYEKKTGAGIEGKNGLSGFLGQAGDKQAIGGQGRMDDIDVESASATELVSRLLFIVGSKSDGSADSSLTESQISEVVAILTRLEEVGRLSEVRPLSDPLIYGNYNVSYTLMGNRQYGQPAGGRFRTGLGSLLFKTTGLFQSVLEGGVVINKVALRILRCIPCYVGLRGTLVEVKEDGGQSTGDTVKVFFDPPVLGFPFGISARIGPKSSVVLTTTYVDERVRIGKGSRGSLFVFTRGGDADEAQMETVGLEKTSGAGKALIAGVCGGMITIGGLICWRYIMQGVASIAAAGWIVAMLGIFLGVTFAKGGIIDEGADDLPDVAAPRPEVHANTDDDGGIPPVDNVAEARAWIQAWRDRA